MGKKDSTVTLVPKEDEKPKTGSTFLSEAVFGIAPSEDDIVRRMLEHIEFYKGENDTKYTVEGSILACTHGYKLTRIGITKDHAIYDNNGNAILTCGDCVADKNVYNFGVCGSPLLDKNAEKTIIDRGVPYAAGEKITGYKCKLQLAPGWQTGKVHTHIWNAEKNKYEDVLPKDGVLTCSYGAGMITIEEVNKTAKKGLADRYYVTERLKLRDSPNGTQIDGKKMDDGTIEKRAFIAGTIVNVHPSKEEQVIAGSSETWVKIYYDITKVGWVGKSCLAELPKPVTGYSFQYNWDKSPHVTKDFKDKVVGICKPLGVDPDHLMAVMAFESRFDTAARNPVSSATGLVQFMADVAEELNTTTAELVKMSADDQLDYVFGYFYPYVGQLKTVDDVYMRVLCPDGIGKQGSFNIYIKGTDQYEVNKPLDVNKDGKITKDEAAQAVKDRRDTYK